ncbi:MAG: hypothetical protein NTX87_16765 [Planctomycetota bacterium]|nr:hypothetical protein [Planctomycetota bacterium]
MRGFLMVVAAAAFLAAGASAAWAQGEFPLKYVLAEGNDPLNWEMSRSTHSRPPQIKALPEGLSDKVRYFEVSVGGKSLWAVLDTASPLKLYVDLARTGDLSSVAPLIVKASGDWCCYGPIDIPTGSGEGAPTVKVLFVSTKFAERPGYSVPPGAETYDYNLGVRAAGYMAGDVKLDGQTYRVVLLERNMDGRYESAFGADGKSVPSWRADAIAIDSDQDGKFEGAGEIMPLPKTVCVKGKYYRVEVAPDGSSIKFEKYEPKMGTLDIGTAASLTLMSDTGMYNLSGADGKWQVPEGRYTCQDLSITKTDAEGQAWTLSRMDMGPLAKFEVRGGETTAIKIGPPLALKVDGGGPPSGGEIVLNLALVGKAGETYSLGLRLGATQSSPPKVKVLDASGKILAEGNSEYG